MVAPSKLVKVKAGSTADELLDDADREPIVVERNGVRYQVTRVSDAWEGYDPQKALQALDETVGIFDDIDTDAWIAEIYEARLRGSRPHNAR